jgi:hypothetical protein
VSTSDYISERTEWIPRNKAITEISYKGEFTKSPVSKAHFIEKPVLQKNSTIFCCAIKNSRLRDQKTPTFSFGTQKSPISTVGVILIIKHYHHPPLSSPSSSSSSSSAIIFLVICHCHHHHNPPSSSSSTIVITTMSTSNSHSLPAPLDAI